MKQRILNVLFAVGILAALALHLQQDTTVRKPDGTIAARLEYLKEASRLSLDSGGAAWLTASPDGATLLLEDGANSVELGVRDGEPFILIRENGEITQRY